MTNLQDFSCCPSSLLITFVYVVPGIYLLTWLAWWNKYPLTHHHLRQSCSAIPLDQSELSHSLELLHSPLHLTITCFFPKVLFASGLEGLVHIVEHCLSHKWAMPTTSTPCRYSMLSDSLLNCFFKDTSRTLEMLRNKSKNQKNSKNHSLEELRKRR